MSFNWRIIAGFTAAVILSAGCSTSKDQLRQAMKDNPDILFDVIQAHPEQFMAAVRNASTQARQISAEKEEKEMEAQIDTEMKTPQKVDLTADRAMRGKKDAPIVVFEWSDFQCPYCGKGFQTVEALRQKYGDKMVFVFRHLPLPFHPMSMPAARRFEAIAMQSPEMAYKFHDEVFKSQDKLSSNGEKFLDEVAKKVGANMKRMKKDMKSDKVTDRIEFDRLEARRLEFSGTPGFVVSGVRLKGAYPQEVFEKIIDTRLKEMTKTASGDKKPQG